MAFFQIGSLVVDVQTQGSSERLRSDLQGAEGEPTFSLTLRRQGIPRKREWQFTSAPLAQADYNALITTAYSSAFLLCTGLLMPAGGVMCLVTVDVGDYIEDTSDSLGFKLIAQIVAREK